MARTAITPQQVTSAGLTVATEPANVDGNSVPPGVLLEVDNGSAGSINVTLVTPGTFDGDIALPNRTVAVAAGATTIIGRLGPVYHQTDDTIHVDYPSGVTSVTVAAIKP
jgi:hypothetical protein